MSQRYSTADGGTVEVTRVGVGYDLHVRDAAGQTVATVDMSEGDVERLMCDAAGAGVWPWED